MRVCGSLGLAVGCILSGLPTSTCPAQTPIVVDTTAPDEEAKPAAAGKSEARAARRSGPIGPEGVPGGASPKLGPDGKPIPGPENKTR